mgnify:CR=1 FL=1
MYVLHYAPDNASGVIRLALEELRQPYRTSLVDRGAAMQKGPDYRGLNPLGLIPTLETADGPIFETAAILMWLSEQHGGLAPPPGTAARGHFLKWLFFLSNTLHADLLVLFNTDRYVAPDGAAALRDRTAERLIGHFDMLEQAATCQTGVFGLLGPGVSPTVVDLYIVFLMRWSVLYPMDGAHWFEPTRWTNLLLIARRMEIRASARSVAKAEGLGPTPFSAPIHPDPPEGSAT